AEVHLRKLPLQQRQRRQRDEPLRDDLLAQAEKIDGAGRAWDMLLKLILILRVLLERLVAGIHVAVLGGISEILVVAEECLGALGVVLLAPVAIVFLEILIVGLRIVVAAAKGVFGRILFADVLFLRRVLFLLRRNLFFRRHLFLGRQFLLGRRLF